jgi:hypothetical protein
MSAPAPFELPTPETLPQGELRTYTLADLGQLTADPQHAFWQGPQLPISPIRAASYVTNPRAQPSDPVLMTLHQEGQLAAYRSILPDSFWRKGAESPERMAWMSGIWVDPQRRGQGLAQVLARRFSALWNEKVLGAEPVPASNKLYGEKQQHLLLAPAANYTYFLQPTAWTFRAGRRWPRWRKGLTAVGKALDVLSRNTQSMLVLKQLPRAWSWREMGELTPEAAAFLARHPGASLSQRGPVEWNWMLQFPWVDASIPPAEDARYYFSYGDPTYRQALLGLYTPEQELAGLALIRVRQAWLG